MDLLAQIAHVEKKMPAEQINELISRHIERLRKKTYSQLTDDEKKFLNYYVSDLVFYKMLDELKIKPPYE